MSTELYTYNNNRESKSFIRDGVEGNYDTVYAMVRLVRSTVTDKPFQNLVNKLLIDKGFNYYSDTAKKFKAIFDYVTENVSYVSDIAGRVESIKSATQTLSDGFGDCDDLSILYATILAALGYEPLFVLANYEANSKQFGHIYVMVKGANNERFVFDGAIPNGQFNQEIIPLNSATIDVINANITDGFLGIFKQLTLAAKSIYKDSLGAIPVLASVTPIGLLAHTALSTGASLASAGLDKDLSLSELGSKLNAQLDDIIKQLQNRQIAAEYARISASQIISQLATANVSRADKRSYLIIAKSLQNKWLYINNYIKDNNYDVKLNTKGMALAGTLLFGYFTYRVYKAVTN